jgi:hypothetical protein
VAAIALAIEDVVGLALGELAVLYERLELGACVFALGSFALLLLQGLDALVEPNALIAFPGSLFALRLQRGFGEIGPVALFPYGLIESNLGYSFVPSRFF